MSNQFISLFLHDYIRLKKGGWVLTKEGTERRYEEEVGGGRRKRRVMYILLAKEGG